MTPIRPRTRSERKAFVVGAEIALEIVAERGLEAAREWLRESAESEQRMDLQRRIDAVTVKS